jgi:hypothetical protein
MASIKNREGVEIEAGDWVVGGEGSDADFGRVYAYGERLMVAWDSGVETPADETMTPYTSKQAAKDAALAQGDSVHWQTVDARSRA